MTNHHFHNLNGEQKEQLLIVCDKNGKPKGLATREECHRGEGKTHLAFAAFVFDKEGRIILSCRSKNKSLWPRFWDASVVSHILPDEKPEQAAKRRGKEELGIGAEFKNIGSFYYFAKYGENSENEYCYVLVGRTVSKIVYNPFEISEIKKIKLDILRKQLEINPDLFTPWLQIAFEMFSNRIR